MPLQRIEEENSERTRLLPIDAARLLASKITLPIFRVKKNNKENLPINLEQGL